MVISGFLGMLLALIVIADFQVIIGHTSLDYRPDTPWYLRVSLLTYPLEIILTLLLLTISFRIWRSRRWSREIPSGFP